MNIPNLGKKGNVETISYSEEAGEVRVERYPLLSRLYLALVIILISTLSFGIGRLTSSGREGVRIEYNTQPTTDPSTALRVNNQQPTTQSASVINAVQTLSDGEVVVSKNGTKYHYPHCSGAKQIKEENKVTYPSREAAEAAGYTLAGNCKP